VTSAPVIQLPLDGDEPDDWLYVVVLRPTGVRYRQQYGGYRCQHATVEGFLVPLCNPDVLQAMRELFVGELGAYGLHGTANTDEIVQRIASIVCTVPYPWDKFDQVRHLELDSARLDEPEEAWVPVITPDGPGFLGWVNSD
jgi:hypothetical protein